MKNFPKQLWLLPLLMGMYCYSCRDGRSTTALDPSSMDLRYGICAAALGLIILVIITSIPWNEIG